MAISIRPLHRSYCPLSCACVGARRAAGGVLRTIVKEKERGGLACGTEIQAVGKFRSQIYRGSTRPLRTRRKNQTLFHLCAARLAETIFLTCVNHVWTLLVVDLSTWRTGVRTRRHRNRRHRNRCHRTFLTTRRPSLVSALTTSCPPRSLRCTTRLPSRVISVPTSTTWTRYVIF